MSSAWYNRLKINNSNKNPPNKLFLCNPQKLTYYYNLIGIKNNHGINISKLKLLLTNQFPYQNENRSLELTSITNKSFNTDFYIYFKFNNIKYETFNKIPYVSHCLVFNLPKLILPKLNTKFKPYSEEEQKVIISKLIKSTSIYYNINERDNKILFNTSNNGHIEITTNNQCTISCDDYHELFLITLLKLRTKHQHLWKSLLNTKTVSFVNRRWWKFNYIQNQNNTKWYGKRRSNRPIKKFNEIYQNVEVILLRNLEKHQDTNPTTSCESLTLNNWLALHQTSIAYISADFELIDKLTCDTKLQPSVTNDINILEDELKELWLTSSDRQRVNNLTHIKHAYNPDHITKQDWLMIWKNQVNNNKFILPEDVDVLTVWSIGDTIIKFICQDIDKLLCLNNPDTIINNLMKETSISIWKALQTKIYTALNKSSFNQTVEQTNSLCEISHEQRLTCMNGDPNTQTLSLTQRDVQRWHQGGICPIESPEGHNIGLMFTLTTYSSIDVNGNILTAYYKVHNGLISNQIIYLSYLERLNYTTIIPGSKQFGDRITCERNNKISLTKLTEAEICYCSDIQFFSPSTNLIPFLKHNDPTRCLMAVNMEKQAIPLLTPQSPLIGTGTERLVTENCHNNIISKSNGIVTKVDSTKIIIYTTSTNRYFVYKLPSNEHNNQNIYIRIRPIVLPSQLVSKGELIAECQSHYHGELSLGTNLLVAFMCWKGYNFEDSVLISSEIVSKGTFQSLHVIQLDIELRKDEVLTNNIKTIPTKHLIHLQNNGIVKTGCKLHANDVIVGKIKFTTKPNNDVNSTNRYSLVYKDSSIRLQNDIQSATVIDVQRPERDELDGIINDVITKLELLSKKYIKHIWHLSGTKTIILKSRHQSYGIFEFNSIDVELSNNLQLVYKSYILKFTALYERCFESLNLYLSSKCNTYDQPNLDRIVIKLLTKRSIKVGDKICGRHGNKGVISKIVPKEDMPFMADGTVIDVIFNPLSIPSRMNVGQILESHLGLISYKMGLEFKKLLQIYNISNNKQGIIDIVKSKLSEIHPNVDFKSIDNKTILELISELSNGVKTNVQDMEIEKDIKFLESRVDLRHNKYQCQLYDGITGLKFDRKTTVGIMYVYKLNHMVDDKIYARSTGPYSTITQQPTKGKMNKGGQRLGEMEVWALQSYGAAFIIQEMLTAKCDDLKARKTLSASITEKHSGFKISCGETLFILIKELCSLCIEFKIT
ncbi:hypothetical protein [Candidatus Hodgkinia cicadicola]|uniref:DNA-directed RNA polymerase subunit beta n=1 Tax=Candidatus Hodgkinia cicadicola TaxID=573658 RepID=A0ABX4MGX0_9HYPH|nr:DNA-directed RNA polymerase subunit beta [Candidatus Hodgkinia cicadicola]